LWFPSPQKTSTEVTVPSASDDEIVSVTGELVLTLVLSIVNETAGGISVTVLVDELDETRPALSVALTST
jgi:hypothetical protein